MLIVLEALTSFISAPEGSDFLAAPQPFPNSVAMLVPAKPKGDKKRPFSFPGTAVLRCGGC